MSHFRKTVLDALDRAIMPESSLRRMISKLETKLSRSKSKSEPTLSATQTASGAMNMSSTTAHGVGEVVPRATPAPAACVIPKPAKPVPAHKTVTIELAQPPTVEAGSFRDDESTVTWLSGKLDSLSGIGTSAKILSRNFGGQRVGALLKAVKEAESEQPPAHDREETPAKLATWIELAALIFGKQSIVGSTAPEKLRCIQELFYLHGLSCPGLDLSGVRIHKNDGHIEPLGPRRKAAAEAIVKDFVSVTNGETTADVNSVGSKAARRFIRERGAQGMKTEYFVSGTRLNAPSGDEPQL